MNLTFRASLPIRILTKIFVNAGFAESVEAFINGVSISVEACAEGAF